MKKKIWILAVALLCLMIGFGLLYQKRLGIKNKQYISRAQAAKGIALVLGTEEEIENQQSTSRFSEKEQGNWYVKYMDFLYQKELFSQELTKPDSKSAGGYLTYGEAEYLLDKLGVAGNQMNEAYAEKFQDKPIPKESWWWFYQELLKNAPYGGEIVKKEVVLYGTPSNLENAKMWEAYTDQEILRFEGLALDSYIDKKIEIMVKEQEIIAVLRVLDEKAVYENLWIAESGEGWIRVFLNGAYRTFTAKELSGGLEGTVADLEIIEGKVAKLSLKRDTINGKVLLVSDDGIEIEGYGFVPVSSKFHVYSTYGLLSEKKPEDILVGYDVQDFVVAEGKICAAVMKEAADAATIRVLLNNSGYTSIFHNSVSITSGEGFSLYYGEAEDHYEGGDQVLLDRNNPAFSEGRIKVVPDGEGEIKILTIERTCGNPSYGGTLEFSLNENGILIINELSLEEYLKKVVPSEMPSSYGLEALKAQAVCARTYGYKHIQGNSYSQYGAHVDDSTKFQVYNNIETQESTSQAVKETYGQIMSSQDEIINAYYFSTSCGATTNAAVWGSDPQEFPYLKGALLSETDLALNLADESVFKAFIKDKEVLTFDKAAAWYRWTTEISLKNLKKKIPNIGELSSVEITGRGENGIVSEMKIYGSSGNHVVSGQSDIRAVFGDSAQTIYKNDGTSATGWSQLPSAFIALEPKYAGDSLTGYTVYGGGFGHGVGMSQNAAASMARAGMNYMEILKFFYNGVDILGM